MVEFCIDCWEGKCSRVGYDELARTKRSDADKGGDREERWGGGVDKWIREGRRDIQ